MYEGGQLRYRHGRGAMRAHQSASSQTAMMPMLSVFLLLLAFFILLVSMVEFDERRTRAALGSLSATFNAGTEDDIKAGSGAGKGASDIAQRLSLEIGAVLETLLGADSHEVETEGEIAIIRIDNATLFTDRVTPSPALEQAAAKIAGIVASLPSQYRYEIEVVEALGVAGATRRAGAIARAFESAGIAAERLLTGLAVGPEDETRIEIYTLTVSEDADRLRRRSRDPLS